jgi:hypothetical protein
MLNRDIGFMVRRLDLGGERSYLHGRVAPGNFTPRLSQNRA